MKIVDISGAQQEKIRPEISYESHTRLIRAMEVAGYIYEHINRHSCEHEPMPWLPEIIDYLREDISCIFKEIDEWELRDSLSKVDLIKENDLQEPCHD
ncbi:hypothetical protein ACWWJF_10210 [Symbiopectobacterium sp. Eva_TO]